MGLSGSVPKRKRTSKTGLKRHRSSFGTPTITFEDSKRLTIPEAAKLMHSQHCSCLIVLESCSTHDDDNESPKKYATVKGIITEKDLVRKATIGDSEEVCASSLSELMTTNPLCLEVDDDSTSEDFFDDALRLMAKRSFRHVPFVRKSDKSFLGVFDIVQVSSSARCESLLAHSLAVSASKILRVLTTIGEKRLVKYGYEISLSLNEQFATALDAIALMKSSNCSAVLVTSESGRLTGIVTERDIVGKALVKSQRLSEISIEKVMTRNPFVADADISPFEGIQSMLRKRFRHLPVSKDGKIIAILDILMLVKISVSSQQQNGTGNSNFNAAILEIADNWDNHSDLDIEGPTRKPEDEELENYDSNVQPLREVEDRAIEASLKANVNESEQAVVEAKVEKKTRLLETSSEKQSEPTKESILKERRAVDLIVKGDFEGAIQQFSEAIELLSGKDDDLLQLRLLSQRGNVFSCNGQLEEAMKDFFKAEELAEKILPSENRDAEIRLRCLDEINSGICEILIETGRFEEAVRRVLKIDVEIQLKVRARECDEQLSREVLKYKDLGKELFLIADYPGAIVAYTNAIRGSKARNALRSGEIGNLDKLSTEDDKQMGILLSNRATCYYYSNDFKYTLQDGRESISLYPGYPKPWVRICESEFKLEKYSECLQSCEQALESISCSSENLTYRDTIQVLLEKVKAKVSDSKKKDLEQIMSLGERLRTTLGK